MKVILNGATAGTNFGDFLFAQMFQNSVSDVVGKENVYWFNSRYAYSDFYRTHLQNSNQFPLSETDALVYISGGYFCGDDKTTKDHILRYLRYFDIGMKCLRRKIPYAIVGLEVAEPKSIWLKSIEKKLLKNAKVLVVRNEESLNCVKKYGIDTAICTADTVFAMQESFFAGRMIPSEIENCAKRILFLHINSSIDGNKELKEKVVPIINHFLVGHPEYCVLISTDQCRANVREVVDDVADLIQCNQVMRYYYKDPIALCKVLQKCDFIVTPKLHVGIVGCRLGKSVVSFSGHTEKIKRVYAQLNESERTTPLSQLSFEKGIEMLEIYHDKPIVVPREIITNAETNLQYLDKFLKEIEERKQS
jgi:polysaccharide pyruvyl transferase WcaK-like protein